LLLLAAACAIAPLHAASAPRIVSTAPSLTEIVYALGLGEYLVGDTVYCTYPQEARSKPKVGTFLQPDYERILALRPTLVLVVKNPAGVTAKLRSLGLRAEEFDQDSIAGMLASIVRIGQLTGRDGTVLVNALRAQLDAVQAASARRPRRSTLFLVGRSRGTLQGMVGVGPGTFLDELMRMAGATNVLGSSPIQYPNVSLEQILTRDPEIILDMGDFAHAEGHPGQPVAEIIALWAAYPRLRAVRNHGVRVVASDTFVRPGPRVAIAARAMFRLINPAAPPIPEPGQGAGRR
jgi:iron complex transport system substrate-binding protein